MVDRAGPSSDGLVRGCPASGRAHPKDLKAFGPQGPTGRRASGLSAPETGTPSGGPVDRARPPSGSLVRGWPAFGPVHPKGPEASGPRDPTGWKASGRSDLGPESLRVERPTGRDRLRVAWFGDGKPSGGSSAGLAGLRAGRSGRVGKSPDEPDRGLRSPRAERSGRRQDVSFGMQCRDSASKHLMPPFNFSLDVVARQEAHSARHSCVPGWRRARCAPVFPNEREGSGTPHRCAGPPSVRFAVSASTHLCPHW
jgi:hypothetical protein